METHITLLILCKKIAKNRYTLTYVVSYISSYIFVVISIFYCTGCIVKYAVKITPIIIRKFFHFSFCLLNSMLLACRENFGEVPDSVEKVEQVCIKQFKAENRTEPKDTINLKVTFRKFPENAYNNSFV
jgi:hypothetical protein